MRKFIIHAGFHKTATSTVQKTLENHRRILKPYVKVIPRLPIKTVRKSAQVFSIDLDPAQRALLQAMFAKFLLGQGSSDTRPIVMSSEDFSGYLIGRHGISDYRAAPEIAVVLKETLEQIYGADGAELVLYYSCRRDGWLKSCHWQLISNSEEQISLEEFSRRFKSASDFDAIVHQVTQEVAPVEVFSADIEDHQGRLGPLQPLLDLCEIPQAVQSEIQLAKPQNVGGSDALRKDLLALSGHNEIREARRTLIRRSKKR